MNYRKPEVSTIGGAMSVIEKVNNSKPAAPPIESPLKPTVQPAYDLDE
jgi:hypothetical protein